MGNTFKRSTLLALMLTSGCTRYPKADALFEGGVVASMAADMATTYTATRWCTEANPIIGHCGDRMPVAVYFPLVAAVHLGISYLIPPGRWRTGFQALIIGVEGHAAFRNTMIPHYGNPPPHH